jgi:hypothetical protein
MQREFGVTASNKLIPWTQTSEVIVGQLHKMIEGDALDKSAKTIASGRPDCFVDRLPNSKIRRGRLDLC